MGVYEGGSAKLMEHLCTFFLHLVDSFEGLPKPTVKSDGFPNGSFKVKPDRFPTFGENVTIHKGWIADLAPQLQFGPVSLAHIDVDHYQSYKDALAVVYPQMISGGVLLFDDYGFPRCKGARTAVDEFFDDKTESPVLLNTKQGIAIRRV